MNITADGHIPKALTPLYVIRNNWIRTVNFDYEKGGVPHIWFTGERPSPAWYPITLDECYVSYWEAKKALR